MRVLITGGGGFIGSHLVDSQLAQGHDVRVVDLHADRLQHVSDHPRLEIIVGDITDDELVTQVVAGVDVVYHLASAHLDVRLSDDHYRHVNVEGTLSLLQAARTAGVRRFVHCSSVGVMGDVQNPPADEESVCRPTNIYEQTKLEGEIAAREFAHRKGLPLVVVRPAWVYGPRCPRTAKLMRTIGKGRFVFFGKGQNLRHPVYISDAIDGLERSARAKAAGGEIYIIAGERPVTIRDLIGTVAEVQGVKAPSVSFPTTLGAFAGHALEFAFTTIRRQPPFSRRSLDFFTKNNAYDIGKARRELGYSPNVDLRTGLEKTLRANDCAEKHTRGDNCANG